MTQTYSKDGVRLERTHWRDEKISSRHRMWGFNCPAVDLDFLMVEYNLGKPVGVIEYKHFKAKQPDIKHPTYRALIELADLAKLPFMIVFYWPECWAFKVYPVNRIAREQFKVGEEMTELEYVEKLYSMRMLVVDKNVMAQLFNIKPPNAGRFQEM